MDSQYYADRYNRATDLLAAAKKLQATYHLSRPQSAEDMSSASTPRAYKRNMSPEPTETYSSLTRSEPSGCKRRKSSARNIFALYDREAATALRSGLVEKLTRTYELMKSCESMRRAERSLMYDTDEHETRMRSFAGLLEYDVGIYWKIKNNKFIVWDFGPGAVAKRAGVCPGDILRCVDGVDILDFKAEEDGYHPIDDLILGKRGSSITLSFLRVIRTDPELLKSGDAALAEYQVRLKRCSYAHTLDLGTSLGSEVELHRPVTH